MDTENIPGWFEPQPLGAGRTALIDVDVQNFQVYGLAYRVRDAGLLEIFDYYNREVGKIVPRIRALKDACRRVGIEIIHLRCASFTGSGDDCSPLFRAIHITTTDGDRDAEVLAEVAAAGDEIVLTKVASGAFNGSDLDLLLRNLGIGTLIFTGLVTPGCVETTVRGAADRGYKVFLVGDACASWTQEHHDVSLRALGRWFATLIDTGAMVRRFDSLTVAELTSRRHG